MVMISPKFQVEGNLRIRPANVKRYRGVALHPHERLHLPLNGKQVTLKQGCDSTYVEDIERKIHAHMNLYSLGCLAVLGGPPCAS